MSRPSARVVCADNWAVRYFANHLSTFDAKGVRAFELISGSKVHISDIKIYPDLKTKSVETHIVIHGKDNIINGSVKLEVRFQNHP